MSFSLDNKYFISSMRVKLAPLEPSQKREVYLKEFKGQVIKRVNTSYADANNIEQLSSHYQDILDALYLYELDWILASIFFEPQADELLEALRPSFAKIGEGLLSQSLIQADLFLDRTSPYDNSVIKGYLKDYFMETIEASEKHWQEEDSRRNPLIYLLELYITSCIAEGGDKKEALITLLFHFAKLWQVYYSSPFDNEKASVLIHRLLQGYQQLNKDELKIDFLAVIEENDKILQSLPTKATAFPLDLKMRASNYQLPHQTVISRGFWNKKNELFDLLKDDRVYFQDLSALSIAELVGASGVVSQAVRQAYIAELERKMSFITSLNTSELAQLSDLYKKPENLSAPVRKILEKILRENYIFY